MITWIYCPLCGSKLIKRRCVACEGEVDKGHCAECGFDAETALSDYCDEAAAAAEQSADAASEAEQQAWERLLQDDDEARSAFDDAVRLAGELVPPDDPERQLLYKALRTVLWLLTDSKPGLNGAQLARVFNTLDAVIKRTEQLNVAFLWRAAVYQAISFKFEEVGYPGSKEPADKPREG